MLEAEWEEEDQCDLAHPNYDERNGAVFLHLDRENPPVPEDNIEQLQAVDALGRNYAAEELLCLAKAYINVSTNPIISNDQKSDTLWNRVYMTYISLVRDVNQALLDASRKLGSRPRLYKDRSACSLKGTWNKRLLRYSKKKKSFQKSMQPMSGECLKAYLHRCLRDFKQREKFDFTKYHTAYCFLSEHSQYLRQIDLPSHPNHSPPHLFVCIW